MRNILFILLGMFIMYIVLSIMAKNSTAPSRTTEKLANLIKQPEVSNLVRTNEFRELIKTREFIDFVMTLGKEQMGLVSAGLVNANVKK